MSGQDYGYINLTIKFVMVPAYTTMINMQIALVVWWGSHSAVSGEWPANTFTFIKARGQASPSLVYLWRGFLNIFIQLVFTFLSGMCCLHCAFGASIRINHIGEFTLMIVWMKVCCWCHGVFLQSTLPNNCVFYGDKSHLLVNLPM